MIGLDTNVLVRYLVEDDPEQTAEVATWIEAALARGEKLFVPQIVVCEVVWVLTTSYGFSRQQVSAVLNDLLRVRQVLFEDLETLRPALDAFESRRADFADHLILERCRRAGCEQIASLDRGLLKEPGVVQPRP